MDCANCGKEVPISENKGLALIDYEQVQKWYWFDSRKCVKEFLEKPKEKAKK